MIKKETIEAMNKVFDTWGNDMNTPDPTNVTVRGTILERAKQLTEGDRNQVYGCPVNGMELLAKMTEQTQAEKLAKEFMAKLTVYAPSKADPIDELHWKEAENWLAQAITQATAELREEITAQIEANNRLVDRIDKLTTERAQAQAQVATLVEAAQNLIDDFNASLDYSVRPTAAGTLRNTLKDTQATADAYTAKVRREAIEKALAAISNISHLYASIDVTGSTDGAWEMKQLCVEAVKSLLPEPAEAAEKGGV